MLLLSKVLNLPVPLFESWILINILIMFLCFWIHRYQGMTKGYSGVFRLGEATSTWDADSPVSCSIFSHLNFIFSFVWPRHSGFWGLKILVQNSLYNALTFTQKYLRWEQIFVEVALFFFPCISSYDWRW